MGTVTVGGSQYSNGGEKQFKEDVVLQLGANANKIKDLNVITDDLINEGLSFKDWPALVQEVHIRNVGYQAASVMEATLQPLRIHPPLHRRRLDFFRKSFVFSTVKSQRRLGFTPEIEFQYGAADTARWYRAPGLF